MAKIKYLGSSDRRIIPKGTDFDGRLATKTTQDVEFNKSNHFVVDSDDAGLSKEAVELLLEDKEFRDVTDAARVPSSLNERLFHGHKGSDDPEQVGVVEGGVQDEGAPRTVSEGEGGRGTTTTGGSTRKGR